MDLKVVLFSLLIILLVFILIVLVRALAFNPQKQFNSEIINVEFDKDKAVESLRSLIKVKTISYEDKTLENEKEFLRFKKELKKLFPLVFKYSEEISVLGRGILLKLKGKSSLKPTVLMSHYDVVPVSENLWSKPPFDAVIENGVLYGRGCVDTKITLNGALFATQTLLESGFVPENDIYFAFSGEEEINGDFAKNVVEYFYQQKINIELVVDEGGAVVENVFPGVKQPCAMIGIAEKGMANVEFTSKSNGGHASTPKPNGPIAVLSNACVNLKDKPFKMKISKPAYLMFNTLGRYSSFFYKIIFANLWCFSWVIDLIAKKSGGEMNALIRTTFAFTQLKGSDASNVIPTKATFLSNVRISPAETVDSVVEKLNKRFSKSNIEIKAKNGYNPSVISEVDCESYNKVKNAVKETFNGAIVSPYLMLQCSDSRHYSKICNKVYRFSACDLTKEERSGIHGNDEKIRISAIYKAVEFYIRLIKNC